MDGWTTLSTVPTVCIAVTQDHTLSFKKHVKIQSRIPKQHPMETDLLQVGNHSTHIEIYFSGPV